MKRPQLFAMTAIVALCGSCYVSSKNPLSSPDTATIDSQLLGRWKSLQENDDEILSFAPKDKHWVEVRSSEVSEPLRAFTTRLGKESYLNVHGTEPDAFIIVRYRIDEADRLQISLLDQKAVEKAIENGEVQKSSQPQDDDSTILTAPPAKLRAFLQRHASAELFPETSNYDRLPSPKKKITSKKE